MNRNELKDLRAKNLKQWFLNKTIPQKEKSYISQLISGKASFGEKSARRLESDYGMPPFYLDKSNIDDSSKIDNVYDNDNKNNNYVIEVLNITASAGHGFLNNDIIEVIKCIEYDNDQAKTLFNGMPSSNLKVINVSGDSMQGTFECGDAIYIDITVNQFQSDGIYVFTFGNGLYVKRLQMIKNKLVVLSDNKQYRDWEITTDEFDQLYIHGKVMLSQSMMLRKHG
ncbi:S24 family peptidase [Gilliamella apis]|uniref:Phage repressor protein n=1 Tax=Gilliamella apis TaxID=1970738 RepID=A0A2V4DMX0_9GAMM|nr:S24 family peptidase [Gilliamella apis]PXY91390.1 phage repressor protein [Gilliamella apis]